jgi:hypothetical protein
MGRRLSFQVEGQWTVFEVTFRCMQARLLLKPGDRSTDIILGVLGRSLKLYGGGVKLLFGGGTSNHMHLILASRSSKERASFKCHLKTNLSKRLGKAFGWTDHLFGQRTTDIPVLDEAALMGRIHYCARHGFKERLIAEDESWPGVPWMAAVTTGAPLAGVWHNGTALSRAERMWRLRGKARGMSKPTAEQFAETIEVPLEPLPCMRGLSAQEQREKWREIFREAKLHYPQPDGPVLGAEKLLEQDPHCRPNNSKRSPAPRCHGSSAAVIQAWKETYAAFVAGYRNAWQRLRRELSRPKSKFAFPWGGVPPTWPTLELPPSEVLALAPS